MKKLLLSFSLAVISSMTVGASELVPVLQESFTKSVSTVIQGGYFAESMYFETDQHADNAGWATEQAYQSERAIKFNAKTKHNGYAVTPPSGFPRPRPTPWSFVFVPSAGTTRTTTSPCTSASTATPPACRT